MKASTDHASQTPGSASRTQTFQNMAVSVFCASYARKNEWGLTDELGRVRHTSAQRDARYMLRMLSKRTMYIIPNERLINALTREPNAAVRVKGSLSAASIWNKVRIALPHKVSDQVLSTKQKATHERSKADRTLSVFHSLTSEATKVSHECLNLAKAGETLGGTQSSGNGKTAPVVRNGAVSVPATSHASMIRWSSGRETAASWNMRATREKYNEGSRN